jgi:uncharacterized protein YjiS (DUF1127 family)
MSILPLLRTDGLALPLSNRVTARIQRLARLWRSRISLARLDDHLLADIGLTRREAETESARPVWDAPAHWHG